MLFYIRQNRGAGAIDIAPGGPAAGRPPARARKRPAHPSSRPGKDREQVCCVAWRPPCAAADGATSTADGATSTKVDARRHARAARFQSPALQRRARAARFSIASPSADGSSVHEGGRPAARPHGAMSIASPSAARCQSPALQRRDVNRQPFSGRSSVHEGGRPAARPHGAMSIASPSAARPHSAMSIASPSAARPRGAISNRQPLTSPRRTEQRPRRWTPGGTPARRDFQSPALQRTGAASTKVDARRHALRRDFQSPALQRTEQRPRRWTPGGTPARRDFNRQPLPLTPATHLLLQLKSLLEGWHLTRTGRRPRRWTPGGTPARRDVNRQPLPLTPAKHLVQQRPRQSKVEPFGWGRKLQCHSGLSTDRSTRIDATGAR
jgi:hypothetical protein